MLESEKITFFSRVWLSPRVCWLTLSKAPTSPTHRPAAIRRTSVGWAGAEPVDDHYLLNQTFAGVRLMDISWVGAFKNRAPKKNQELEERPHLRQYVRA